MKFINNYGTIFGRIISEIDVSEANYIKSEARYKSISSYINKSSLNIFDPEIYVQGSFKLGTAIRPITEEGSYDIDFVCEFKKLDKNNISQYQLKEMLGSIVFKYAEENGMKNKPRNGKRCWTLKYIDEDNFHVDILPSIPFNQAGQRGLINITDKTKNDYYKISDDWETSNPKGYFEWFMAVAKFSKYKDLASYELKKNIEEIPDYSIKTPLQRIVQILKRHAEVMFEEELEFKPSSIIITTLAATAYSRASILSQNFEQLFVEIINSLIIGVEYKNNTPMVINPTNKEENLSEKWGIDEKYFYCFMDWIEQLKIDFILDDKMPDFEKKSMFEQSLKVNLSTDSYPQLDFLDHYKKSEWSFIDNIAFSIKGYKSSTTHGRFKEMKSGTPIGKSTHLRFEVDKTFQNYEIIWQITNTGNEARKAKCLRGDFYNSEMQLGKQLRTESSSYLGKHYVEAYLIKNGYCYGKSEPFVVNVVKGLKGYL